MKKILLAALVAALPLFVFSQTFSTADPASGDLSGHIEAVVMQPAMSKFYQLYYRGDGFKYSVLTSEDKKPFKFNSMAQIFNFLNSSDYSLVAEIPIPQVLQPQKPAAAFLFKKE